MSQGRQLIFQALIGKSFDLIPAEFLLALTTMMTEQKGIQSLYFGIHILTSDQNTVCRTSGTSRQYLALQRLLGVRGARADHAGPSEICDSRLSNKTKQTLRQTLIFIFSAAGTNQKRLKARPLWNTTETNQ